ncbi:hypothetical protein ACET3Z_027515 [Daucus carota]
MEVPRKKEIKVDVRVERERDMEVVANPRTRTKDRGWVVTDFRGDLTENSEIVFVPYFELAIRLTDDYDNLGWLKIDPPKFWFVDKAVHREHSHTDSDPPCSHVHSNPIRRCFHFYTNSVDMIKVKDIHFCKYPLFCCSASIGSTIYCVGGDKDIDADVNAIFSELIGPPITSNPHNFSRTVPRNNLSHKIGSLDPRDRKICWMLDNAPTLFSPRYLPKIVAVGEKIYLFGGNRLPVNNLDYVPFAEVFDPEAAPIKCFPICDPPFPSRIGQGILFVAPFLGRYGERKILVMSRAIYIDPPLGADAAAIYDIPTDTWEPFYDPDRWQLLHHTHDIIGAPIPVAHQDSIYWLGGRFVESPIRIASYNWKTKHFWKGTIYGLQHESPFDYINDSSKILLHLNQDLFYLVWDDLVSVSTSDDDRDHDHTHIHFTLLRVCREDPPSTSLSAFVVGCFSYILPMTCDVERAYVLKASKGIFS